MSSQADEETRPETAPAPARETADGRTSPTAAPRDAEAEAGPSETEPDGKAADASPSPAGGTAATGTAGAHSAGPADTGAPSDAASDVSDAARERKRAAGAETTKTIQALRRAHDDHQPVQGKVVAIVRGGYEVDLGGVIGFCPFNQIDIRRNDDQLSFLRQTLTFMVSSFKRRGRSIALSRRRYLEREARRAQREVRKNIKPGTEYDGKVSSLTDYGAFVDIGGVEGMVHVSEISHERVARPADRLNVGQAVRVKVLRADTRKGRIALSMKALEDDPWTQAGKKLKTHQVISGTVARVTDFGVFVEVAPGVDGLLHVSELPPGGLESMKPKAEAREQVLVLVLRVEARKKRVSLTLAPEDATPGEVLAVPSTRPGSVVTGTVEAAGSDGVTVRIGPGCLGIIPPNETSTPRGADLRSLFPAGTEVSALVMPDRSERGERRVRLSIRRAERREERRQLEEYRKSDASGSGAGLATLGDFFRNQQKEN